jgi:hypothetical protein
LIPDTLEPDRMGDDGEFDVDALLEAPYVKEVQY